MYSVDRSFLPETLSFLTNSRAVLPSGSPPLDIYPCLRSLPGSLTSSCLTCSFHGGDALWSLPFCFPYFSFLYAFDFFSLLWSLTDAMASALKYMSSVPDFPCKVLTGHLPGCVSRHYRLLSPHSPLPSVDPLPSNSWLLCTWWQCNTFRFLFYHLMYYSYLFMHLFLLWLISNESTYLQCLE